MLTANILFYILSLFVLLTAVGVLLSSNPIMSALNLVLTMVGVAGLFFLLESPFIAGAQILVYAGAVTVLFVIVLMIFDTNEEDRPFEEDSGGGFKSILIGIFAGILCAVVWMARDVMPQYSGSGKVFTAKEISVALFTDYVLSFEVLGVMLLVIPIGVVALARSKGGTHEQ